MHSVEPAKHLRRSLSQIIVRATGIAGGCKAIIV